MVRNQQASFLNSAAIERVPAWQHSIPKLPACWGRQPCLVLRSVFGLINQDPAQATQGQAAAGTLSHVEPLSLQMIKIQSSQTRAHSSQREQQDPKGISQDQLERIRLLSNSAKEDYSVRPLGHIVTATSCCFVFETIRAVRSFLPQEPLCDWRPVNWRPSLV